MKKLITSLLAISLFASPLLAVELSPQEKNDIAAKVVEQLQNGTAKEEVTTASKVKEWVGVGAAVGSGLGSAAKEIGVTANEFAKTPVGVFTAFLVGWHFIGDTAYALINRIVHVGIGIVFLAVAMPAFFAIIRRSQETHQYYEDANKPTKVTRTRRDELSDDAKLGYTIVLLILLIIGVLIMTL